jgi:hypothetical protein
MVQLPNLHTDPLETVLRAHFSFLMVSLVVWQRFPGIFKNEWPHESLSFASRRDCVNADLITFLERNFHRLLLSSV